MIVYFNYDLIERTLNSFQKYRNNNEVDIFFIENPSKNSSYIKELANKYNIDYHYICNENLISVVCDDGGSIIPTSP